MVADYVSGARTQRATIRGGQKRTADQGLWRRRHRDGCETGKQEIVEAGKRLKPRVIPIREAN